MQLSAQTVDFGVVPNNELSSREVEVFNAGTGDLVIKGVKADCGCTEAQIADSVIKPGAKTVLTIKVNPAKLEGFGSKKQVMLFTNQPGRPRETIPVTVKVDPEFLVEPSTLDFGKISKGQRTEATVLVRQLGAEPVEVTGLTPAPQSDGLECSFEKRPQEQWVASDRPEYTLHIAVSPDAPSGPFLAQVVLGTTCRRVPRFTIPVKADIAALYTVSPRRLRLEPMVPGQRAAGTITFNANDPLTLRGASVTGNDFEVSTSPGAAPNTASVVVSVRPDATPGNKWETVSVTVEIQGVAFVEPVKIEGYIGPAS